MCTIITGLLYGFIVNLCDSTTANMEDCVLFVCNSKVPSNNVWGTTLIDDISKAFDRVSDKLKSVRELIISGNKEITESINTVKEEVLKTVASIEKTADGAMHQAAQNASDIHDIKSEMSTLKREMHTMKEENKILKEQSIRQELYSRRDNLIVNGIADNREETDSQCKSKIQQFFQRELGLSENTAKRIIFVRCHRLGKYEEGRSRSIIMRFCEFDQRQSIWFSCSKLRGKPYSISEDYPKEMSFRRRLLYPIFKLARNSNDYQSVTLKLDELLINTKRYNINNLHLLPSKINPQTLSYKTDESTYVVGGLYSEFNHLSNWSKCNLSFRGHRYPTLEHCWQHNKAMKAENHSVAFQIMCTPDARTAKELGKTVIMSDVQRKRWDAGREELMTQIVKAKVDQNINVRSALLDTKNKRLGETGTHDPFYTIGVKLTHPNVLKHNDWKAGNLMGRVLEKIRSNIVT